ncbi:MAG: type VI secretion system baseplate subunit TssE [Planctomycetes bacterium]|nr:type VI secretion system baseplate subunit TssE [Planctomycetota bacterium]
MAREIYQPTILDRLCPREGEGSGEGASYEEIRESVRRDLEDLFNTRQGRDDIPPQFSELARSIAAYGLRNFNSTNLESPQERQNLLRAIERTVRAYEPRLDRIELRELPGTHPFELRFEIKAVLRVAGYEDRVVFGTTVRKDGGAVVRED